MSVRIRLPIVLVAVALAATGVVSGDERKPPRAPSEKEIALSTLLVEKLGPDAATIEVVVEGDKVLLSGDVEERVTRELAGEVARSFDGIRKASNRVRAANAPRIPEGYLLREGLDAELERRVEKALKRADLALSKLLSIEAADGVVAIRGDVSDASRRARALSVAREVPGVTLILDLVRVSN